MSQRRKGSEKIDLSTLTRRLTSFYGRHEVAASILFFFGGVTWDFLTLGRIDALYPNIALFFYLLVLGGLILVATLVVYDAVKDKRIRKYQAWYRAGIQFLFGALFSAFVFFYAQSASLSETASYLVLLFILLIANEFIHRRVFSLYLLLALYFLAASSFFSFFIPVVTKQMSYAGFLVAHLVSLLLVGAMLGFLYRRGMFPKKGSYALVLLLVLVQFGMAQVAYHRNWIPPVPLAMRDGGVYHRVSRTDHGYRLQFEPPAWYEVWLNTDRDFHHAEGDTVFCFTAVFAPTALKKKVFHAWQYYDAEADIWQATDRIGFELVGGRTNGYRGYTFKRHIQPGTWRVVVETSEGRILGRIPFNVLPADSTVTGLRELTYR